MQPDKNIFELIFTSSIRQSIALNIFYFLKAKPRSRREMRSKIRELARKHNVSEVNVQMTVHKMKMAGFIKTGTNIYSTDKKFIDNVTTQWSDLNSD